MNEIQAIETDATQETSTIPDTKVEQFIEANLPRWQSELAALCAIPGVSAWADTAALQQTAQFVKQALAARQLETETWTAGETSQPTLFGQTQVRADAPTLLFYNHYDVQPIEPLSAWHTDPFVLTERDGCWWARGVADGKGNLLARLAAVETYRAVYGELPINLKFIIEGEHENGSPNLTQLVADKASELAADVCVWEDGQYSDDGTPILNLGLKGILSVELISRTLSHDIHSSLAGIMPSAAWRLMWALAAINDDKDGIQIHGFYDDIAVPTKEDSQFLAETRKQYTVRAGQRLAHFGADEYTAGIKGLPLLITEFFTPTANVSGMQSGYVGPGTMAVLPAYAMARLDFRLVPNQQPLVVLEQLKAYLKNYNFDDLEVRLNGAAYPPARTSPSDAFVGLAARTAREVAGVEPLLVPLAPTSGPLAIFKAALDDLPTVGVGAGYDGSNQHAPDENIRRDDFVRHVNFLVQLMRNLVGFKNEPKLTAPAEAESEPELEPFNLDFGSNIFENNPSEIPISSSSIEAGLEPFSLDSGSPNGSSTGLSPLAVGDADLEPFNFDFGPDIVETESDANTLNIAELNIVEQPDSLDTPEVALSDKPTSNGSGNPRKPKTDSRHKRRKRSKHS